MFDNPCNVPPIWFIINHELTDNFSAYGGLLSLRACNHTDIATAKKVGGRGRVGWGGGVWRVRAKTVT